MTLFSGVAVTPMPVPPGTPMGGYADRIGGAAATADPLTVGAVTFFDGSKRAALVIADVVCVNRDVVDDIRQALAHIDIVWVSATHTHSGPETGCVPGGGPTPQPWRDRLTDCARIAVEHAIRDETAGPIGYATAGIEGIAGVRTLGLATPIPVDIVRLPGAQIVVLPVHPTVLPATSNAVSADLPGALRRELTRRTGLRTLVFTGAAGDISTRPIRRGQDRRELARLAAVIAGGLPSTVDAQTSAIVGASTRKSLARHRFDPGLLETIEAAGADTTDPMAARIAETRLQGARLARSHAAAASDPIDVEVSAIAFGDLTLVGLPGEPFLDVARHIRDAHPRTIVLGYTNGYPGYLPTREAYATTGYEILASVVAPGGAETLADTATTLVTRLRENL